MTTVEKMKRYRWTHGYSIEDMKIRSGASASLLKMVENGMVTHPKIARQIADAYELTDEEAYELMPPNHRPNHEEYDPNKYKESEDMSGNSWLFVENPKSEMDIYIAEHQKQMQREHQKGGEY